MYKKSVHMAHILLVHLRALAGTPFSKTLILSSGCHFVIHLSRRIAFESLYEKLGCSVYHKNEMTVCKRLVTCWKVRKCGVFSFHLILKACSSLSLDSPQPSFFSLPWWGSSVNTGAQLFLWIHTVTAHATKFFSPQKSHDFNFKIPK